MLVLVAGLATVSTATAVLSAAGAATIVWLAFSAYCSSRR
jgi:threonine/homoserine/homoserine lactone efflux protein